MEKYISVPKITVLGSQSAGKSSILEALSGITFPRAAGTCTRCPTEVRLFSSDEDWVCTVTLRIEKAKDGKRLDKVCLIPFGDPITDPDQVQHRLVQAQRAILNRSKSAEEFLTKDNGVLDSTSKKSNEIQFSENVICIEVKGKNVRDLAVVDLPGLIANVGEKEDPKNIDLIKSLAINEISKPESVILLCVTMSEDYQTQPSVMLAKEADPTGQRTLGVLTKPDRVEEGCFETWVPVLNGTDQKLHHGYYVVKNPDPVQLKSMTHAEARIAEKAFFEHDKDWALLDYDIKCRLGSDRLAEKLSMLLEHIIRLHTPVIIKGVKKLHDDVMKQLSTLPPEVKQGHALKELYSLVASFIKNLETNLEQVKIPGSLAEEIYHLRMGFWKTMLEHRPRFLPIITREEAKELRPKINELQNYEDLLEAYHFFFHSDTRDLATLDLQKEETQTGDQIPIIDISQSDCEKEKKKDLLQLIEMAMKDEVSNIDAIDKHKSRLVLNMTAIRALKARSSRDMLPGSISWDVIVDVIKLSIYNWSSITMEALQKIEEKLIQGCDKVVNQHFGSFEAGNLKNTISDIMKSIISEVMEEVRNFLRIQIKIENHTNTINVEDFSKQKNKLVSFYRKARAECHLIPNPMGPFIAPPLQQRTAYVPPEQRGQQVQQQQQQQQQEQSSILANELASVFFERLEEEIKLVGTVRAYWQVAMKRFTDQVDKVIKIQLVKGITEKSAQDLGEKLGLYSDQASNLAKSYLQEDAKIVNKRAALIAREATLAQGLQVINAFTNGLL